MQEWNIDERNEKEQKKVRIDKEITEKEIHQRKNKTINRET